jgi:palmitoyltransferase
VLETQSFSWKNPTSTSIDGSSSNLIAYNYFSLVKDIERLNDLCTIARNLLATTKKAQNLAAEKGFDQQILKLIDVCVRVTARGFDGESNVRNEERWNKVVNLYKRLLITCLQFLHNFIMHNESRKLLLWLDLFGTSPYDDADTDEIDEPEEKRVPLRPGVQDGVPGFYAPASAGELNKDWSPSIADLKIALGALRDPKKPPIGMTHEEANLLAEKVQESINKLENMTDGQRQQLEKRSAQLTSAAMAHSEAKLLESEGPPPLQTDRARSVDADRSPVEISTTAGKWDWANFSSAAKNTTITAEDMTVTRTPQSAATTLQEAKDQLMARLQDNSAILDSAEDDQYDPADGDDELDDDHRSLDAVAGDQERGLLTDIPLVLGPSEIEALPMIIQAGIVDSFGLKGGERVGTKNMQSVRCHILLAQEAGRNLLRELLIFIAAWDLPDDEFYFKMMVQIMEAILKNGLMPLAYQTFGQAKDIISPAQAVVIKILTQIFRGKYSPASSTQSSSQSASLRVSVAPSRVDVLVVRYIFTVFRQSIIPETCALIYLQGQIRQGHALSEDFPLNLWDMERVYEGVYQFLEFFAVLTESTEWKGLLVKWEIVSELVTLIRELDASIPKAPLSAVSTSNQATASTAFTNSGPNTASPQLQSQTAVAVERPYDPLSPSSPTSPTGDDDHDPTAPISNEDPADFEWRNLKKLVVLVLSSLVWKCPTVQNQIRQYGGVEMILACTNFDAHNPYIKEHAVMCLKFLLEGNKENQKVVEELEARQVVQGEGSQLLEKGGMEAVIDENGRVVVKVKGKVTELTEDGMKVKVTEMDEEGVSGAEGVVRKK